MKQKTIPKGMSKAEAWKRGLATYRTLYCNKGTCSKCARYKKIYLKTLCGNCYDELMSSAQVAQLEATFKPKTEYNEQLFELYLKYIRRYGQSGLVLMQARRFAKILATEKIQTIKSWYDVYLLDAHYPGLHFKWHVGRPFIKVGQMLEEIGLLPPRQTDKRRPVENALLRIAQNEVTEFTKNLLAIKTSYTTVRGYLAALEHFKTWLAKNYQCSLLQANHHFIEKYLSQCNGSYRHVRNQWSYLKKFFEWCLLNRKITCCPTEKIHLRKQSVKITVCDEATIKTLNRFIKNKETDAEYALVLTLILYWGLSPADLATAQVNTTLPLRITFRRQPLTRGRATYNREQVLCLPTQPKWFLDLQTRFLENWNRQYLSVAKSYPHCPLLLAKHNLYNRFIHTNTVRKYVREATVKAVGFAIPCRVLRQTCGHIHATANDASILATLGWSSDFAFAYTWAPRILYRQS